MLAETATQLEVVAEMFPKWREMQRSFSAKDSELFVRAYHLRYTILKFIQLRAGRCEELNCPLLALRVFSNHPKYAFPLSSNLAALQLLHSLHLTQPLQETITASALFKVNNLPQASSSLTACALLVAACLHSHSHPTRPKDPRARELADTLLPVLKTLCMEIPLYVAREPSGRRMRAKFEERPKIWTVGALRRIKRIFAEEGRGGEFKWLDKALRKFARGGVEKVLPALSAPEILELAAPAPEGMGDGE
jgi:hypothetical protein